MSQAFKTHARQGRGAGNGYNEKWHNSPLWDSFEKKKEAKKSVQTVDESEIKETVEQTEEETLKEKQRKLYAMVY